MRLYARNGWWHIDLRSEGHRKRIALKTKSVVIARKRALLRETELDSGSGLLSLDDVLHSYQRYCEKTQSPKTVRPNSHRWRIIRRFLSQSSVRRISQLNRKFASEFTQWLWQRQCSNASVNRYISLIRAMLTWTVEQGFLPESPLRDYRKLPERRGTRLRIFTREELRRLVDAAPTPTYSAFIELLTLTGARMDELRTLPVRNVDLNNRQIILEQTKTHLARTVPLNDRALQICRMLIGDPHNSKFRNRIYLFGDRHPAWNPNVCGQTFARIIRKIELSGSLHDIRRTFVSRLVDAGVGLKTVQDLIGDKTARMVLEVYAQTLPGSAREAVNKIS